MVREIITQSHAARIRGVSRSRINELVKEGRFSVPVDINGKEINGAIYLDEIVNFTELKRGRPAIQKPNRFVAGDNIIWKLEPRGGYGYIIPIIATVIKNSNKRIQIKFVGGDGEEHYAWADRKDCFSLDDASDNEFILQLEKI